MEIITEEIISIEPAAVPTDNGNLYCYREISEHQKKIYRIILTAARNMTEGFFTVGYYSENIQTDIAIAYQAVSNDNPELFWLPYSYLINGVSEGSEKVSIALSYNSEAHSCSYLIQRSEQEQMSRRLEAAASEIISKAADHSRFEAEIILHDELCKRVVYTSGEAEGLVYTAFGALVNGKAVCEGYARAMQLLCGKLGIPCILVFGESRGTGHMWNLIDPGDGWYHLDVTWDDNADGKPYYLYFNLNDDEISDDHTIASVFSKSENDKSSNIMVYECTGNNYNYFRYKYLILDESYALQAASAIETAAEKGASEVTLRCISQKILKLFENNYNSCAAEIQRNLDALSAITVTDISIVKDTITFYWK